MTLYGQQEVLKATGLHPQTLARLVESDRFPQPVQSVAATRLWRESDVLAWKRANERRSAPSQKSAAGDPSSGAGDGKAK